MKTAVNQEFVARWHMYLTGQINFKYSQFQLTGQPAVKVGLMCLLPDIKDLTE